MPYALDKIVFSPENTPLTYCIHYLPHKILIGFTGGRIDCKNFTCVLKGTRGQGGQGDAVYLLTSGQFERVVFSDLLAAGNGFTDGRKGYPQPPA